jgi:hypothetical protein
MKTTRHIRPWRKASFLTLGVLLAAGSGSLSAKPDNGKGKGHDSDSGPPGLADKDKGDKGGPPGLADKGGVPPGHRRAPVEIIVRTAPPPVRVEKMPARPVAGYVWVPGYWSWAERDYVWVSGVWVAPPAPAAVWVTPRFETRRGASIFITGYWKL